MTKINIRQSSHYSVVWIGFDQIFRDLNENQVNKGVGMDWAQPMYIVATASWNVQFQS